MTAGAPDMWRPPAPVERPIVIAFAAGAIFFLGYTLNIYNGALADRRALSTLCAAIACSAIAYTSPDSFPPP